MYTVGIEKLYFAVKRYHIHNNYEINKKEIGESPCTRNFAKFMLTNLSQIQN